MFAVHYKFKSAKDDYSTITFDTPSISLAELKERILEQNNLKRAEDFDLKIVNSQTGEDYSDPKKYNDHSHIPKNTSVIVSRVPVTKGRLGRDSKLGSGTGTSRRKPTRILGPDYICHRCGGQGHFIHECPTNGNPEYDFHKVKKATGIPKTFLQPVSAGDVTSQALRMANGGLAIMKPNVEVFEKSYKIHMNEDNLDIPNDYKCPLCKGVLRDPVLIPCCGYSFCSECISPDTPMDTLLCPTCKRVTHPSKFVKNKELSLEIEKWIQDKENGNASSETSEQDKESESAEKAEEVPDEEIEKHKEENVNSNIEKSKDVDEKKVEKVDDTEDEKKERSHDEEYSRRSHDDEYSRRSHDDEYSRRSYDDDYSRRSYDDDYSRRSYDGEYSRRGYDDYRKDRYREYDRYRRDRYDDRYYDDYKRDKYDYKGKSRGYDKGDDYRKRERRVYVEDRHSRYRDDKYRSKYRDYDRSRERQSWKRERERSRYY